MKDFAHVWKKDAYNAKRLHRQNARPPRLVTRDEGQV